MNTNKKEIEEEHECDFNSGSSGCKVCFRDGYQKAQEEMKEKIDKLEEFELFEGNKKGIFVRKSKLRQLFQNENHSSQDNISKAVQDKSVCNKQSQEDKTANPRKRKEKKE